MALYRFPIEYEYIDNEHVLKIEDWLHEPLMKYMRWVPLLDSLDIELNIPQETPEILSWLTGISLLKTNLIEMTLIPLLAACALSKIMVRESVRIVRVVCASAHGRATGKGSASVTRIRSLSMQGEANGKVSGSLSLE